MRPRPEWEAAGVVAGVHLAASAQPPRATSLLTPRFSSSETPQPFPPASILRTNGALLESLGCCGFPPAPVGKELLRRKTYFVLRAGHGS